LKKIFSLLIIALLAFGLVGCSDEVGLKNSDEAGAGVGSLLVSPEGVQKDYGAIVVRGEMNDWGGWGTGPDLTLTDEDEDGIYTLEFSEIDTSDEKVKAPQEGDGYKIVVVDENGKVLEELTGDCSVGADQTEFSQEYVRYEEASEDTVVKVDGEDYSLGEEVNLETGSYDVTVLDGKYATKLEDIQIKVAETNTIEIEEPLKIASGEVTFKFDPSNYDFSVTDSAEVCLAGAMTSWTPGDTLMNKNDDGTYSLTVSGVIVGQGYKLIVNNDPENMDWGWEAPDTDDRILITPDGLDAPGADNYQIKFEDIESGEISEYEF